MSIFSEKFKHKSLSDREYVRDSDRIPPTLRSDTNPASDPKHNNRVRRE